MAVIKDRSNLPVAPTGIPPASERMVVHRIAEAWARGSEAPWKPDDRPWRASQAGKCARQIAYEITGAEQSDPPGLAAHWVMGLGSKVHELLLPAVREWIGADPNLVAEEEVAMNIGDLGFGHADLVLKTADGKTILIELKTINGFGFKRAVADQEGPKSGHKLQAALYAHTLNADLLVIAYLGMENMGPGYAAKANVDDIGRFAAEWHYTPAEFIPWAEAEIERLDAIAAHVWNEGEDIFGEITVPRRFSHHDPDIPFGAQVNNPKTGHWQYTDNATGALLSAGTTWQCNYCNFQTTCIGDMNNENQDG